MSAKFPRIATLKTAAAFRAHLEAHQIALGFDDTLAPPLESPFAAPLEVHGATIGNRFAVLPMEGWDGERNGEPSDLTRRRWQHFGQSGAKLIWGGEAVAVRHDGRASPNQLLLTEATLPAIAALRDTLVSSHRAQFGSNADADLLVGLQLTHSGRFAKPDASDQPDPLAACAHPILDRRFAETPRVITDDELDELVETFIGAARLAQRAGFRFVDLKQCHGYLGHELLGARTRGGRYGGSLENRLRFVREVIAGVQAACPGLGIGVRLSAFDMVPFRKQASGEGVAETSPQEARNGFGLVEGDDLDRALEETRVLLRLLQASGVRLVCITGGSPYYCPHVVRPAFFPPMDGYQPPEDPLHGVARQIRATALLKAEFPGLVFVGSAYSYLQEWLPHVGQHTLRHGMADLIGIGRMVLSYPAFPADVLAGRPLRRGAICRTFSDCTTGPRMGFVSGCYPLDPGYESRPEAAVIRQVRTRMTLPS